MIRKMISPAETMPRIATTALAQIGDLYAPAKIRSATTPERGNDREPKDDQGEVERFPSVVTHAEEPERTVRAFGPKPVEEH